jgi:uncharacterized protein (TIGR02147 family)
MKKSIFDYRDYKGYLLAYFAALPKAGRGMRLAVARSISSPVSHISQVLNGNSHFSMEQAEGINEFLGHTQDEAFFFLLLVNFSRAGTSALRKRIEFQIQQVLTKRMVLKDRLGIKQPLNKEAQTVFYSSWLYGAVHVMLTIPKFRTKESIGQHLGISNKRAAEILEFLVSVGLALPKANGKYEVGNSRIHLGNDSPLISKFHSNWRMRAITSLDQESVNDDLHYSSAITISDSDFFKIKSVLVKTIEEAKEVIRESTAENIHCFNIDFFKL